MAIEPGRRQFLMTCLAATGLGATRSGDHGRPREDLDEDLLDRLAREMEVRDRRDNRDAYEPRRGAKFLATDTGGISIGDGEEWVELPATGINATFDSVQADAVNGVWYVDPEGGYDGLLDVLDHVGDRPSTIVLGPGRIDDVDGNVPIPSNTWFRGRGAAATTLAFADDADPDLAGLLRITGENVRVSDLKLDGNRSAVTVTDDDHMGQEYGVYTSGARHVTIDRVYCHSFPGYGIDPHADGSEPSRYVTISNCRAENNGFDGVTLAGVEHGVVAGTTSVGNDRHGVNLTDPEGDTIRVLNTTAADNGGSGLVVQNDTDSVFVSDCTITGNGVEGVRIGNGGSHIDGVVVTGTRVADNAGYGVNLRPCDAVTISNCAFERNNRKGDATAEIATTADGTAVDLVVSNNQIRARADSDHGVDERSTNGPCLITGNLIRGSEDAPVASTHPETVVQANLTR